MANSDLSDVIYFMRYLKKNCDKDVYNSKLEELAYVAESTGIPTDDFHTLVKLWLNLTIPITKWTALGACLVPQDRIEERSVDYAFRWLLSSVAVNPTYSKIAFMLDWLTAAMDTDSIDMAALDSGYPIFYSFLEFEQLTPHALKLIYNLTKPSDVKRDKVLELLKLIKLREDKKSMVRQLQVLLGLFKSYRPECVPEAVPSISIHTSFKKINSVLLDRFRKSQARRKITHKETQQLLWSNQLNNKNSKVDPLIPEMVFTNISGQPYYDKELNFSDPISLVSHVVGAGGDKRPARLRALLCNGAGLALLAVATETDQVFHNADLHHMLTNTFLDGSPHSLVEKMHFLDCIVKLQRTLMQPVPAVTHFLAQFLPFWNEMDYFEQILGLVEWLSAESPEQMASVIACLSRVYLRAQPLEQCAILKALTTLYSNLVFLSSRKQRFFLPSRPAPDYSQVLPSVHTAISDLCQKGLQAAPGDMRVLHSALRALESCALATKRCGGGAGAGVVVVPRTLPLAVPLLSPSALALDKVAALLLVYRKIFSQMKAANKMTEETIQKRQTLENYVFDFLNCIYHEKALANRRSGILFERLHPQLVSKLTDLFPNFDAKLSLKDSLAFAPYHLCFQGCDYSRATNKMSFNMAVSNNFPNLHSLLVKAVSELRM